MAPAIVPKRWTAIPGTFGKAAQIEWRQPRNDREADRLAAAQMQHDWAWQINAWRRVRKLTIADVAPRMGTTEQRLGALLRGDSPADLIDIVSGRRIHRRSGSGNWRDPVGSHPTYV